MLSLQWLPEQRNLLFFCLIQAVPVTWLVRRNLERDYSTLVSRYYCDKREINETNSSCL